MLSQACGGGHGFRGAVDAHQRPLAADAALQPAAVDPQSAYALRWLSLERPGDYAAYRDWLRAGEEQRPHDHPGFLNLVRPEHYSAAAVVYRHAADARITYPFFYCELNRLQEFSALRHTLRHLVSPYGYGGAVYEGSAALKAEASACFEHLLNAELQRRSFVTEFVREDIFSARLALRQGGRVECQPNVLVRLEREPEAIWRNYKHAVRSNIKRAQKQGLSVHFDPQGEDLPRFLDIYYETMQRRGAGENFRFPARRFIHLGMTLGRERGLMYAHVRDGRQVVSSELLLLSQGTIYSFLGGSRASAFSKRPNNLLKHEVILWGQRSGYKWLVLGGGLSAGDDLLRYKESFDPGGLVPFSVRRVIHDPDAYALLLRTRAEYEEKQGRCWRPRPGFFPEYLSDQDRHRPSLVAQDDQ